MPVALRGSGGAPVQAREQDARAIRAHTSSCATRRAVDPSDATAVGLGEPLTLRIGEIGTPLRLHRAAKRLDFAIARPPGTPRTFKPLVEIFLDESKRPVWST